MWKKEWADGFWIPSILHYKKSWYWSNEKEKIQSLTSVKKEKVMHSFEIEIDTYDISTPYIRFCKYWFGKGKYFIEIRIPFIMILYDIDIEDIEVVKK